MGQSDSILHSSTKVVIWDDHQMSVIAELVYNETVSSVKLRRNALIVVTQKCIYAYNLSDLKLRDCIRTYNNEKGLCAVTLGTEKLAYPDAVKGKVMVKVYDSEVYCLDAFDTMLACIEFNPEGNLLACASDKGTSIKIYNVETKELLHELRRGIDKAEIYSIAFHNTSDWVVCSSDKGTVHVYNINSDSHSKTHPVFIKKVMPKYFETETSYSKFRSRRVKTVCCFAKDDRTIILVTADGVYHAIEYSDPGECKEIHRINLMEI